MSVRRGYGLASQGVRHGSGPAGPEPWHPDMNYFRSVLGMVKAATGCIASDGATDTCAALPFKKRFTQVVFKVSARCTENEATATAPIMMGTPTEGFTTHQIFP